MAKYRLWGETEEKNTRQEKLHPHEKWQRGSEEKRWMCLFGNFRRWFFLNFFYLSVISSWSSVMFDTDSEVNVWDTQQWNLTLLWTDTDTWMSFWIRLRIYFIDNVCWYIQGISLQFSAAFRTFAHRETRIKPIHRELISTGDVMWFRNYRLTILFRVRRISKVCILLLAYLLNLSPGFDVKAPCNTNVNQTDIFTAPLWLIVSKMQFNFYFTNYKHGGLAQD